LPFNSYYNAKLLLTAEYLVLNGAKALAVPLRFGQSFNVEENDQHFLFWKSVASDGNDWFWAKFDCNSFEIVDCSSEPIAIHLQHLLIASRKYNNTFCTESCGYKVSCTLNYPLLWGLGSSSTLLAGIAGWANIDPFQLHVEVSKGSGYDIACAIHNSPLMYQLKGNKPEIELVKFSPAFADQIYFVYQGRKQDSAEGILKYKTLKKNTDKTLVEKVDVLTNRMLHASNLTEFDIVIREHEQLISNLIGEPPIKEKMFNDLNGEVKSLGAWGGDFCMLTWHSNPLLLPEYLKSKGLETWFNFHDIVL